MTPALMLSIRLGAKMRKASCVALVVDEKGPECGMLRGEAHQDTRETQGRDTAARQSEEVPHLALNIFSPWLFVME